MPADMKPIAANARRHGEEHHQARPFSLRAVNDPAVDGHDLVNEAAIGKIGLTAAVIAIRHDAPMIMVTPAGAQDALPAAEFTMPSRQSLDGCLRDGVLRQAGLSIGHAEQLVTFTDQTSGLAIGYLALTRASSATPPAASWRSWYDYLPWEDWRNGRPACLTGYIEARLRGWAQEGHDDGAASSGMSRTDRVRMAFGLDRAPWNEERVADRFEIMVDAGLTGAASVSPRGMRVDHARVLAHAVGRLRAKLKTRPVIFELMEPDFTLFELQKTVEAILGPHLHKQNFRRLVESAGLVEPTGEVRAKTGGRPAKLFRFRHEVLLERPAPGVRVHTPLA